MQQHELLLSVSKYLSRFKEQIKILNANGEFSINIHAENVLISILNIIYNCNLKNTNYTEGKNYNSIDLKDEDKKISIQITSTSNIEKIKHTLRQFIKYKHLEKYEKLVILILTDRQQSYSQKSLDQIIQGKINFEQGKDIIDLTSIYVKLSAINDLKKTLVVNELLASQFRDIKDNDSKNITFSTFEKLKDFLKPLFIENGQIFKDFGPNSGAKSTEPLRWDLTLWYKARREKLVPNNSIIANIIKLNTHLISKENEDIFNDLLSHIYAFEKHCEDANFDYSSYLFPNKILKIFDL